MKVVVKGRHMKLTPALHLHVEDKILKPLQRIYESPAAHVEVELCDLGHIRSGENKECHVTLSFPGGRVIVITEIDDDMYKAIDLTHHRLLLQLNRYRGRTYQKSRSRKWATQDRAAWARLGLTRQPEVWEQEVTEYEHAQGLVHS